MHEIDHMEFINQITIAKIADLNAIVRLLTLAGICLQGSAKVCRGAVPWKCIRIQSMVPKQLSLWLKTMQISWSTKYDSHHTWLIFIIISKQCPRNWIENMVFVMSPLILHYLQDLYRRKLVEQVTDHSQLQVWEITKNSSAKLLN